MGDTFTSLGTPTILFEAGFIPLDYHRYNAAQLIFRSLKRLLKTASTSPKTPCLKWTDRYHMIPENKVEFSDILLRNTTINFNGNIEHHDRLLITLKEELIDHKLCFLPVISTTNNIESKRAHYTINCSKWESLETKSSNGSFQIIDSKLDQIIRSHIVS